MKLMELLAKVSQADLDEVVSEITMIEGRLEQLKEVRKIIELKLGLRKPPGSHLKGRGKKRAEPVAAETNGNVGVESPQMSNQLSVTDQYRLDAKRFIMANGPQPPLRIAKACGIPTGSITAVLKHKSFKQCEHGYELNGLS